MLGILEDQILPSLTTAITAGFLTVRRRIHSMCRLITRSCTKMENIDFEVQPRSKQSFHSKFKAKHARAEFNPTCDSLVSWTQAVQDPFM